MYWVVNTTSSPKNERNYLLDKSQTWSRERYNIE